jgi:hypothetical protein
MCQGETANVTPAFDVILSAESVYREETFGDLLCVLKSHLKVGGAAYFAAKRFYFGLGGGTVVFSKFIKREAAALFSVESVKVFEDGLSNIREIIVVRRDM